MFRIWANRVLKEFIIKGYVMDDARLREPENLFGKDYFEEQLGVSQNRKIMERQLGKSFNVFQVSGSGPPLNLYHEFHRGI